MKNSYVDKIGLSYFWSKIKLALNAKANLSDLSSVATSGSYNDLVDIPQIPDDTHIASLINSALEEIEDGYY